MVLCGIGKAASYMRTTIHIEDGLFADLMRLTHATTKTQAVRDALKEFIRLRRKEELLALRGRLEIEDNWRQLRESELEEA
jgi:Arc/MetJ family transcription regulator